jgi:formylglycine-generating enzyme required for sulfatase activity
LLKLEARTCHLISFYSCAEAAYTEWLLAVPSDDPRRRDVIEALFQAQQGKPLPDFAAATGQTVKHCEDCPLMIEIGPGAFDMGKPGRGAAIRFDKPFAIARTEVTQRQWQRLMGGNPSEFSKCGADCPVENVSWNDAQEYVRRLAGVSGKPYRLPSEAEWEAACRAGEDGEYCGAAEIADVTEVAWYGAYGHDTGNSGKTTHPVASRRPNAWGFHDMSGNVREWVADSWQPELAAVPANGSARADSVPRKVVKGGSWVSKPAELKASHRDWDMATDRYYFTGFRVAVTLGN